MLASTEALVGQIYGMEDIAIRARLEGFLESIHFKEGARVKKGDLLYTMDSQPFDAEVAAKKSMVAEAKTMLGKAESDLKRIRPLAEKRVVSQSDLDSAVAGFEAAKSSVKAAEAELKAARIQQGYTPGFIRPSMASSAKPWPEWAILSGAAPIPLC